MKIVSKYKDYYDNALSYGVNTTQVYVRNEELIEIDKPKEFDLFLKEHYISESFSREFSVKGFHRNDLKIVIKFIAVGFCGKYHIACQFSLFKELNIIKSDTYYDLSKISQYAKRLNSDYSILLSNGKKCSDERLLRWIKRKMEVIQQLFDSKKLKSWFVEFNTPLIAFPAEGYSKQKYDLHFGKDYYLFNGKTALVLHPILKSVDFYRQMNAFECYQAINQFKFGVLANKDNITDNRSDIEKVHSHGFDQKYGFRKRPRK